MVDHRIAAATVLVAATSALAPGMATGNSDWDPANRTVCGNSQYATRIQIYRYSYVDCAMAETVARKWASRRGSSAYITAWPIKWSCSRVGGGYGDEAFGGRLPAGQVQCTGYRGVEFLRFKPHHTTLSASLLTAEEVSSVMPTGRYEASYNERWTGYDYRRARPKRCQTNVTRGSLAGLKRSFYGPGDVANGVLDFPTVAAARHAITRLRRQFRVCPQFRYRMPPSLTRVRLITPRTRHAVELTARDLTEPWWGYKTRVLIRQQGSRLIEVSVGGPARRRPPNATLRTAVYRLSQLIK